MDPMYPLFNIGIKSHKWGIIWVAAHREDQKEECHGG